MGKRREMATTLSNSSLIDHPRNQPGALCQPKTGSGAAAGQDGPGQQQQPLVGAQGGPLGKVVVA